MSGSARHGGSGALASGGSGLLGLGGSGASTWRAGMKREWVPTDLPGLISWYDADDASTITESGGAVSQWSDKGGADHHATQAFAPKQPTTGVESINGRNALGFDYATNHHLTASSFALGSSGDHAVFGVVRVDSVADTRQSVWAVDSAGNDYQYEANNASQFDGELLPSGWTTVSLSGGPWTGVNLFGNVLDYTGLQKSIAYVNGEDRTSGGSTYGVKITTPATLCIMVNRSLAATLTGAIGELVVIEGIIASDRQRLEGYLAHRWGIASLLPSGHPYKSAPPRI